MPFAAFDLEIARQVPNGPADLMAYAPLGIACAAVATPGAPPRFWHARPQMTRADASTLVDALQTLVAQGYTLLTWNGCAFDFQVLAQESGRAADCGHLALHHVDLMLIVAYTKGYRLSLETALQGAGLTGKARQVTLRDGRRIAFTGAEAPRYWAAGECDAVLAYLEQDVVQLLALGEQVARNRALGWTSRSGKPVSIALRTVPTVCQCAAIPLPDTSWMDAPPRRAEFVAWIPGYTLGQAMAAR